MLVEEVDVSSVKTPGDILSNLVRASALNHVQLSPAILGFGTGRSTDEEVVL